MPTLPLPFPRGISVLDLLMLLSGFPLPGQRCGQVRTPSLLWAVPSPPSSVAGALDFHDVPILKTPFPTLLPRTAASKHEPHGTENARQGPRPPASRRRNPPKTEPWLAAASSKASGPQGPLGTRNGPGRAQLGRAGPTPALMDKGAAKPRQKPSPRVPMTAGGFPNCHLRAPLGPRCPCDKDVRRILDRP